MNALVFFLKRPLARVVRGEKINETKEWGRGAGGGPEVATTDPTRWLRVIEPDENSPPPQTRKRLLLDTRHRFRLDFHPFRNITLSQNTFLRRSFLIILPATASPLSPNYRNDEVPDDDTGKYVGFIRIGDVVCFFGFN